MNASQSFRFLIRNGGPLFTYRIITFPLPFPALA